MLHINDCSGVFPEGMSLARQDLSNPIQIRLDFMYPECLERTPTIRRHHMEVRRETINFNFTKSFGPVARAAPALRYPFKLFLNYRQFHLNYFNSKGCIFAKNIRTSGETRTKTVIRQKTHFKLFLQLNRFRILRNKQRKEIYPL